MGPFLKSHNICVHTWSQVKTRVNRLQRLCMIFSQHKIKKIKILTTISWMALTAFMFSYYSQFLIGFPFVVTFFYVAHIAKSLRSIEKFGELIRHGTKSLISIFMWETVNRHRLLFFLLCTPSCFAFTPRPIVLGSGLCIGSSRWFFYFRPPPPNRLVWKWGVNSEATVQCDYKNVRVKKIES